MGDSWSVFVSHTNDMAGYPVSRSFVQAAVDAVLKAGHRPVDMAYFAAREGQPAEYCRRRVRESDVYVGVVGFCYGSLVPQHDEEISYTDLEFREASAAGLPRLVFLLDPDAAIPRRLVDVDGRRVEGFRKHLREVGVIVRPFTDAGDLGEAVLHALGELRAHRTAGGNGEGTASPVRRPWMVPRVPGWVVDRPELAGPLLAELTRTGTDLVEITSALEGAGGFGKTTLAAVVCHRPEVGMRFPGGILWATVGDQVDGPALAGRIAGLCEVLSGRRPTTSDPMVAGAQLGELLDARPPTLLVIDDVWHSRQLEPFLVGGAGCRRLITTRNRQVVPRGSTSLIVDEMTVGQARRTLTTGVKGIPAPAVRDLLRRTGRWPVLLGLVNAAIAEYVQDGATPAEAAAWVLGRLDAGGPTAVDLDDADSRDHAVAATMAASMRLLTADQRDRYLDLAIFPVDVDAPMDVVSMLWGASGWLGEPAADRLRDTLVRLRLARGRWDEGRPALGLHDVIRSYLQHLMGSAEVVGRNAALVAAARRLPERPPTEDGLTAAWWALPPDATYLWRHLPYHLAEAGQVGELTTLVCDLRWVEAKSRVLRSPVPAEADLAPADDGRGRAAGLRRALAQMGHLLTPIEPATALGATLASRLENTPGLETVVEAFRAGLPRPCLANRWRLPDQAHPALLRTLEENAAVNGCVFSPDGSILATAAEDLAVRLWNTATGMLVTTLAGHTGGVSKCAFSPDSSMVAAAGADRTARIWVTATGATHAVLEGHGGSVTDCAFSPDGTLVATTSYDQTARIWDVASGELRAVFTGHTFWVTGCAFSPASAGTPPGPGTETLLATTSADHTTRIWELATGRVRAILRGHRGTVTGCAFSADGAFLVTSSNDRTAKIWKVAEGTEIRTLSGHTGSVTSCAVSPCGQLLATGGDDRTVRTWDLSSGRERELFHGHGGPVTGCALSPDGALLATSSSDGTARIWDGAGVAGHAYAHGHSDRVNDCSFSPDGAMLATASYDTTACIWDVSTGTVRMTLTGHAFRLGSCAFSPDGRLLATTSHGANMPSRSREDSDVSVRIWDVNSGEACSSWIGHTTSVSDCSFSPDGNLLATVSHDTTVCIWDVATGAITKILAGHRHRVHGCAFSPDGNLLATASADQTIRIWAAGSEGEGEPAVLAGHSEPVYDCTFSPDGALLATASQDTTACIWDVATGTRRATLAGHTGHVNGCAFSPDGSLLATVGSDRTVRVWDMATGECGAALRVTQPLFRCAWHPSDLTLCAVGDGGVYILDYLP